MKVRRVVTGHDRSGKAVFASDTQVDALSPALLPGSEFHRLWGGNRAPSFPDDGSPPVQNPYFPPVGGFRFGMFTLPPDSQGRPAVADLPAAVNELESALPGLASFMEADAPGMHTTATITLRKEVRNCLLTATYMIPLPPSDPTWPASPARSRTRAT